MRRLFLLLLGCGAWVWSEPNKIEVSRDEMCALEEFFQVWLTESEGNYVLTGVKPVCVEGVARPTSFLQYPPEWLMVRSEQLERGYRVWKRLAPYLDQQWAITLHAQDGGWRSISFIHKPSLLSVIQDNLSLFRAELGVTLTPEQMVERILDARLSFEESLNHSRVLIGIVLGFGVENALVASRWEDINELQFAPEALPLKRRSERLGFQNHIPIVGYQPRRQCSEAPQHPFITLDEEKNALDILLCSSREQINIDSCPVPLFSCVKDSVATSQLLNAYQIARKEVLEDPNLLRRLFSDVELIIVDRGKGSAPLASDVAECIVQRLQERDSACLRRCVGGMQLANQGKTLEIDPEEVMLYYQVCRAREGLINLREAEKSLKIAIQSGVWDGKEGNKALLRKLKMGEGPLIDDHTAQVCLAVDQQAGEWFDCHDLIPGLAKVLRGCRVGDQIEVLLHPDIAYGYESNFPPGMALRCEVVVIEIKKVDATQSLDFRTYKMPDDWSELALQYEHLRQKMAYLEGFLAWKYLNKTGCDFREVVEALLSLQAA